MNAKKKIDDIEKYEKEITKDFEAGKFVSVPDVNTKMQIAKQAAKNYTKRDSRVNIRLSVADLSMIRKMADDEGLPYQTLLSSIIHKFVSGRLIDSKNA